MEVIAEVEKMRATIGMAMTSQAIPEASVNSRIFDALKGDPAYEIETRGMGEKRTLTCDEILWRIATRHSDLVEEREQAKAKREQRERKQGYCRARGDQETWQEF